MHPFLAQVVMVQPLRISAACSAAHAVLDVIESENLTLRAQQMGSLLLEGLEQLATEFPESILQIRGRFDDWSSAGF